MNKKLIIVCIGVVFMLTVLSIASAVNVKKDNEKKISPIFNLRINRAIDFKFDNIRSRFTTSNRLFFNAITLFRNGVFVYGDNYFRMASSIQKGCFTYESTIDCRPCLNLNEENSEQGGPSFLVAQCLGYKTCSKPTFCNEPQCGLN